jgi:hypothetical protein
MKRIMERNSTERHPVGAGVPQCSRVSPILFAICTSGLIKWVEEYVSEAERLFFIDDLGWVATGSNLNHVVPMLERCAAKRVEWATR